MNLFEIDKIPDEIYAVLTEKGIPKEEILLAAYCDRDRSHTPCDTYLAATQKELAVLTGTFSRETDLRKKRTSRIWNESEYTVYSLEAARF